MAKSRKSNKNKSKSKIQYGGNNNQVSSNSSSSSLLKLLIVIVIAAFMYYYFNQKKNEENNNNNSNNNRINNTNGNNAVYNNDNMETYSSGVYAPPQIIRPPQSVAVAQDLYGVLRNYDYKTYNDPLTPPYKRDDYMIPAHVVDPNRFGLYTRGGPTAFKKMGYLSNPNAAAGEPYKFLTLMGRQKYYNSTQYEYYVVSTNRDENIKFDLDKKRELFSGDTVKVSQLNNVDYDVTIDKNLDYEYSPYIV
jgi:hypothetical protein